MAKERMTSVSLLGSGEPGIADWGRKTSEEMIRQYRKYAEMQKLYADRVLAARDEDFRVETYRGVNVKDAIEVLQDGKDKDQ